MSTKGGQVAAWLNVRGLFAVLVCSLALFGCDTKEPASISGVVLFADAPIEEGTVRFHPVGDTPGPGAGANVVKGKYAIDSEQGLLPGGYLVAINAWEDTGEEIPNPEPRPGEPDMIPETIQYIPEIYNQKSTLYVQVKPGANEQDFKLIGSDDSVEEQIEDKVEDKND